jgi:hypothetical protein
MSVMVEDVVTHRLYELPEDAPTSDRPRRRTVSPTVPVEGRELREEFYLAAAKWPELRGHRLRVVG